MKNKKIFVNKITKKMNNNQSFCDVSEVNTSNDKKEENNDNQSVLAKLDQLFNTNGYIFNIDVKIITNKCEYNTKIASKVNNYIITLDNNIICIDDIKDILVNK